MQTPVRKAAKKLRSIIRSETVTHRGITLPATFLRFGGEHFADDEAFLCSGEREAERLQREFGLRKTMALLDIGCGPGRLPIGVLSAIGEIAAYRGMDVSATPIEWCKKHIETLYPTFQFLHLNVKNERYNPQGTEAIRLPFQDRSFDIIYLYSVFSHMKTPDIEAYLSEFRRLLKHTGHVFLTAFIENNVPEMEENPEGYKQNWKGALHCVRYEKDFFERLVSDHGLTIEKFYHGTETDGQSAVILSSK